MTACFLVGVAAFADAQSSRNHLKSHIPFVASEKTLPGKYVIERIDRGH